MGKTSQYGQPGVYNAAGVTLTSGDSGGLAIDVNGRVILGTSTAFIGSVNQGTSAADQAAGAAGYPSGAVPVTNSSANQANTNAVATLAAQAAKFTYITGFQATAGGSTTGSDQTITVAGVLGGTMNYTFVFPASVTTGANVIVNFPMPIPSSAVNTAIVVTLPAGGAGNTNATVAAQGFQL